MDLEAGGYKLLKELHGLPRLCSVSDFQLANLAKSHANVAMDQSNSLIAINHSGKLAHRPTITVLKTRKRTVIARIKFDKVEQLKPHQISMCIYLPFCLSCR